MKKKTFLIMSLTAIFSVLYIGCSQNTQSGSSQNEILGPIINGDCIAHYYKSNDSSYITHQQHQFSPESSSFHSTSTEPIGTVQCTLIKGVFDFSGSTKESLPDLPREQWDEQLATSVYFSFCAGADLLDTSSMKAGDKIKIEGRWYESFVPDWPGSIQVTLLKSLDTNRVELVKTENLKEGFLWLLRGYNYRYSKDLNGTAPRTIDVFDIFDGVASKALMVRFDYKDIRQGESSI